MGAAITDAQERRQRDRQRHPGVDPGSPLRRRRLQGLLGALLPTTRWRLDQDFTTNDRDPRAATIELARQRPIQCALNGLDAGAGAATQPRPTTAPSSRPTATRACTGPTARSRFMIVLGDSLPHDATMNSDFPDCPNTPPTDPGRDAAPHGRPADAADADGSQGSTTRTSRSSPTTRPASRGAAVYTTFGCQSQLAQYTGGSAVIHGADTGTLENQIVDLINQAASHVDSVTSDDHVTQRARGRRVVAVLVGRASIRRCRTGRSARRSTCNYDMTVSVPQIGGPGPVQVPDPRDRRRQRARVSRTSRSTSRAQPVSALALTTDQCVGSGRHRRARHTRRSPPSRLPVLTPDVSSAPGGLDPRRLDPRRLDPRRLDPRRLDPRRLDPRRLDPRRLDSRGLDRPRQSRPPARSPPARSPPARSRSRASCSRRSRSSARPGPTSSRSRRSRIQPLAVRHARRHRALLTSRKPTAKTPWERLSALPLKNVPFFTTLWRSVPFAALMLGNAPLDQPADAAQGPTARRTRAGVPRSPTTAAALTGVDPSSNTVFGLAISGQLGSTPAGSIPAGSIPAGSIARRLHPRRLDPRRLDRHPARPRCASALDPAHADELDAGDYVNCAGGFNCTGKTLGDAYAAGAINPTLTLDDALRALPAGSISARDDDRLRSSRRSSPLSDYPWEQINVQGLQDVAGTGQNVRYHVDFDLDCSHRDELLVHVNLPDGFFPVPGSSAFSYAGARRSRPPNPIVRLRTPVWPTLPGSPCGGGTLTRHVRLDFSRSPASPSASQNIGGRRDRGQR